MSIASELTNLEGNIEDSYDAVNDMGGIIPAHKNMNNLDQAIRTIPQNTGTTYTAGTGIDITSDVISVDNTTVPFFTDLATVATTGDYGDLLNTPTIPAAQVNSDWNANSGVAQILNKPSLATVATSGLYSDLTGTPSLATVATSGDYDDLLNKPTIPTVNDATLTIQHNGTNVQTFTANQSTNATANIETIWADDIEATTPVPAVETAMIADGAVTSAKIDPSVLEYRAGDTYSLSYFDIEFAGRQITTGGVKKIFGTIMLDKPVSSNVSTITFTPSSWCEAWGKDGTIYSYNNPSSSQLTFALHRIASGSNLVNIAITIVGSVSNFTSNTPCVFSLYGNISFS